MARWVFAALALATSALTACGVQTGSSSKTASSPGATQKTITLGATRIEPDDLTMASTDVLTFMNTAVDPLQVEFIKPPSQAGKIGCHVADPKSAQVLLTIPKVHAAHYGGQDAVLDALGDLGLTSDGFLAARLDVPGRRRPALTSDR